MGEEIVVRDLRIFHGTPIVKGTRIPVLNVLGALMDGVDMKEVNDHYPDLTEDQVVGVLVYVADNLPAWEEVRRYGPIAQRLTGYVAGLECEDKCSPYSSRTSDKCIRCQARIQMAQPWMKDLVPKPDTYNTVEHEDEIKRLHTFYQKKMAQMMTKVAAPLIALNILAWIFLWVTWS